MDSDDDDAAGVPLHRQRRHAGLRVRPERREVARAEQPQRGGLQRGQPRVLRGEQPRAVLSGSLMWPSVNIWVGRHYALYNGLWIADCCTRFRYTSFIPSSLLELLCVLLWRTHRHQ